MRIKSGTTSLYHLTGHALLGRDEQLALYEEINTYRRQILEGLCTIPSTLRDIEILHHDANCEEFPPLSFFGISEQLGNKVRQQRNKVVKQCRILREVRTDSNNAAYQADKSILIDLLMSLRQQDIEQDIKMNKISNSLSQDLNKLASTEKEIMQQVRMLLRFQQITGLQSPETYHAAIKTFRNIYKGRETDDAWVKFLIRAGGTSKTIAPLRNKLLSLNTKSGIAPDLFLTTLKQIDAARANLKTAQDKILRANLGLAKKIASNFRHQNFSPDEILAAACIGLMKAIDQFDHRGGFGFSAMATPLIEQEIKATIDNQAELPIRHIPGFEHPEASICQLLGLNAVPNREPQHKKPTQRRPGPEQPEYS